MIRLHQFRPALGLPNASPFCMKVELYLRMAGIPYENVWELDPRKGPKGKMPWIEDGGRVVADSGYIVEHLQRTHGDPLDTGLAPGDKAVGLAIRRMIEEHLYWTVLYFRWADEPGWTLTRNAFFGRLPPVVKQILPVLARRGMVRELWNQGTGRHSRDEIVALANADVSALAEFLGDKPYFLGEHPTSLDATAYAFLANLIEVPLEMPVKVHATGFANLVAYCGRMREHFFP